MMLITRALNEQGETVLRQGRAGYELIVDGQFLMSSASCLSSVALVANGLDELKKTSGITVLIGGLGLGYSLRTALADGRVKRATVVELEPVIIDWHRQGLLPITAEIIGNSRVQIVNRDLVGFIAGCRKQFDLVALDIDNGPDWLSHESNASLYTPEMIGRVKGLLYPGGVATFWSADQAPWFKNRLNQVFGNIFETECLDTNGAGKSITAYIYLVKNG